MPLGGAVVTAAIPLIGSAIGGLLGMGGAGRAAKAKHDAQIAAAGRVDVATQKGQDRIDMALNNANEGLASANTVGQAKVNEETERGNSTLQKGFEGEKSNLDPYLTAGAGGIKSLQDYVNSKPTFSFNPSDLQNDPGYQFQ